MNLVRDRKIGEGGFGTVFICKDATSNKKYAIKEINSNPGEGYRCLLEVYVMIKSKHQTINRANGMGFGESSVRILQSVAIGDLSFWIRGMNPSDTICKKFLHQMVAGLDYLHNYMNIIHGDIKPGNILCYPNNMFKLTDFSVSVLKTWHNQGKTLCTNTHRPPEVWLRLDFDEKTDIWSLGCTFYEMLYKKKLFPNQAQGFSVTQKNSQRSLIIERSMRAIWEWATFTQQNQKMKSRFPTYSPSSCKIVPINQPKNQINSEAWSILLSMLRVDPHQRPGARQILASDYLKSKNRNPNRDCVSEVQDYSKYDRILRGEIEANSNLSHHIQFLILRKIQVPYWNDIARHSCIIYERYTSSVPGVSRILHATCLYTAYNLVMRVNPNQTVMETCIQESVKEIVKMQKKILVKIDSDFF